MGYGLITGKQIKRNECKNDKELPDRQANMVHKCLDKGALPS